MASVLVGCFVIAAVFAVPRLIDYMRGRMRTRAMSESAIALGIQFEAESAPVLARLGHLAAFREGSHKQIRNLMTGARGSVSIKLFDFRFTSGTGKQAAVLKRTFVVLQSGAISAPPFVLRPKGVFDKLGTLFRSPDIDFPSHPLFSRKYMLRSEPGSCSSPACSTC